MAEGTLILNAAKDIKNSVNNKELEDVTRTTLSQILDTLLSISGPYARNNFILGNAFSSNNLSNSVSVGNKQIKAFTKDGRHILSRMDYASPIQKYIKDDIVTHIGMCIDDKCGDGTTSAMIFATSFVANVIKYKDYFNRLSTNLLEELYKEITSDILSELDKFTITTEDEDVKPWHIAYLQAFTSSGGMENVANAVGTIIKNTPKELWKYAITQKYPKGESESDELIKVIKEDYQYGIPVTLFNPEYIFKDIESVYECSDAEVIIAPYGLINNDPLFEGLKDYIQNKQTKPLIVIIPNSSSKNLEELLYIAEKNNKEVLIFGHVRHYKSKGNDWTLNALNIKANKVIPTPELNNIRIEDLLINASVYTNGKYLKVNGFLPDNEDSVIHPVFTNEKEYQNTASYLPVLYRLLNIELAMPEKDIFVINDLKSALSIVTSVYNTIIEINGTALDQQMISLILDDATSAAQNSLLHGMVFNGPYRLYQAAFISGINSLQKQDSDNIKRLCSILLYKCLLQAAMDMTQAAYGKYSKDMQNTIPEYLDKFNLVDKTSYYTLSSEFFANTTNSTFNMGEALNVNNLFNYDDYKPRYELGNTISVNTDSIFKAIELYGTDKLNQNQVPLPPCQPVNFFKELFNRVRESCLRFALIDELIVPGTVWDNSIKTTEDRKNG